MKYEYTIKSLAELSPELLDPESAKPTPPTPAGIQQPQQTQSLVPAPDYSKFEAYRHWGLND